MEKSRGLYGLILMTTLDGPGSRRLAGMEMTGWSKDNKNDDRNKSVEREEKACIADASKLHFSE